MGRVITVNDRMQNGYRYRLAAPSGRNFDPAFRPELTPKQMLKLGVFCGKYLTDCRDEFSDELVRAGQAFTLGPRLFTQLFRRQCQPTAFGLAKQRLDSSRRSAWLVSVVLPLLHRTAHAGRGRAPDRPLEGDAAACLSGQEALRAGRSHVPPAPTAGALALGL